MSFSPNLPWMKINDYLLELGSESCIEGLYQKALDNIYTLIPSELPCNIFGADLKCLKTLGDDGFLQPYNDYYYKKNPLLKIGFENLKGIDWRDFENTEYVTDLIYPYGPRYTLGFISPGPIHFSIHRTPRSPAFTDQEHEILKIITPHVNNFASSLNTISMLKSEHYLTAEIVKEHKILSSREVDVAVLLCQRLTAPEIASRLLISPRTVEFHINNIYEKLKVKNRRELMLKFSEETLATWLYY